MVHGAVHIVVVMVLVLLALPVLLAFPNVQQILQNFAVMIKVFNQLLKGALLIFPIDLKEFLPAWSVVSNTSRADLNHLPLMDKFWMMFM